MNSTTPINARRLVALLSLGLLSCEGGARDASTPSASTPRQERPVAPTQTARGAQVPPAPPHPLAALLDEAAAHQHLDAVSERLRARILERYRCGRLETAAPLWSCSPGVRRRHPGEGAPPDVWLLGTRTRLLALALPSPGPDGVTRAGAARLREERRPDEPAVTQLTCPNAGALTLPGDTPAAALLGEEAHIHVLTSPEHHLQALWRDEATSEYLAWVQSLQGEAPPTSELQRFNEDLVQRDALEVRARRPRTLCEARLLDEPAPPCASPATELRAVAGDAFTITWRRDHAKLRRRGAPSRPLTRVAHTARPHEVIAARLARAGQRPRLEDVLQHLCTLRRQGGTP